MTAGFCGRQHSMESNWIVPAREGCVVGTVASLGRPDDHRLTANINLEPAFFLVFGACDGIMRLLCLF